MPPAMLVAEALELRGPRDAATHFAEDAELTLVGGATVRGRAAIADALGALDAAYGGQVEIGRIWTGRDASVIELLIRGAKDGHAIGLVAGAVVTFDRADQVTHARI
jgi:hypothetical protein